MVEETMKVAAVVGLAVLMSFIGFAVKGGFGAAMGFVITLLIIGFFVIWKKYSNMD